MNNVKSSYPIFRFLKKVLLKVSTIVPFFFNERYPIVGSNAFNKARFTVVVSQIGGIEWTIHMIIKKKRKKKNGQFILAK